MTLINSSFEKFTGEVCAQIKCSEVHTEIKEELMSHLEEIREEYISQGSSSEEAERLAVAHMGDSETIGYDLNKVYKKKPEYKTLIITSIIASLGLFIQFVIASYTSSNTPTKCVFFTIVGIIVGIAAYFFDYRKLEKYSIHIFIAANLLILIALAKKEFTNGTLTLSIFGNSIEIAFVATIMIIISLNGILPKLYSSSFGVIKIIALYAFSFFMLSLTNQYAYMFIFLLVVILLLIYIDIPKKYVTLLGLFFLSVFSYSIFSVPYRFQRIISFMNFNDYKTGSGYLKYNIHELISASKLLGNGTSRGIFKILPDTNTDFIYCYIIYTFGWLMGAAILVLILSLLVNLFKTSKIIKNSYGKTILLSISTIFAAEFLFSILTNLNLSPIMSVAMPFISYSGASTVVNMALIGLICSIYGRKNLSRSLTLN